ncbi:peroxidasin-like isoform X1 [Chironomus tepperi]|uniref:peroxidasin-like isoform X1 n=1 Tax=Chironomus tepperi TaxID=113505 RepID=UPI00391F2713
MNAIIFSLTLFLIIFKIYAIILPCDFSFDKKYGYTCRVGDINITKSHVKIKRIGGNHIEERKLFNRTDTDVLRVIMFNRTINFLPVNITYYFPYLRTLQVKKCGLKRLTRAPDLRFTLRRLYLGFNEIKNIPEKYFWHFCRLETLSLHGNQISNIPRMAFRDLISLKRLSLNNNHLMSIDSVLFTNCLNLEYIDLENNLLQYIESKLFSNQPRLYKVLMRNNQIGAIESEFLSRLKYNETGFYALLGGNRCIDNFEFPLDGNYEDMRRLFVINCPPPPARLEPTTPRTTTKAKKKPKYKTPDMIFYENCTWNIHADYAHHFKPGF